VELVAQVVSELRELPRSVVPDPIDEERRGAGHAAADGVVDVRLDPPSGGAGPQVLRNEFSVCSCLAGVAEQGRVAEVALVHEEEIVHGPEPPLQSRCLRCFGRRLSPGVQIHERHVPKDEQQGVPEVLLELTDHQVGFGAI